MSTWDQTISGIGKLRAAKNSNTDRFHANRLALLQVGKKLDLLERSPSQDNLQEKERLQQEQKKLQAENTALKSKLDDSVKGLQDAIEEIYEDPHPRKATANLDDQIPFLLLPVRIETRFMTDLRTPELWVRIYPDDIAIHTQEKWLTPNEVTNGEAYWKNLFDAEKQNSEELKKAAWKVLATLAGSQRAAWIARQTRPVNWSNLDNVANKTDLQFPVQDVTAPDNWTTAPRTYMMPDKFVINLYTGDALVKEVPCNPVPDELIVGPDPLNPDGSFKTQDNKLVFGEDFDWTSNFEKARTVGMGIKIPITADQARVGFDRIVVLGLSLSMSDTESTQQLENLVDNHHYSPDGFSIVKQGTPTNNTEQDGSGFTSNDPFNAESYYVETGNPLFGQNEDKDGRFLADALGVSYGCLQYIGNADATDRKEAVAMNTALYPSTLGYYFDTMLAPALSRDTQTTLRDFFTNHVTGCGPLPAIRVGNQPYGVLLTSDFDKWTWDRSEQIYDVKFLAGLLNMLRYYNGLWKSLVPMIASAGKPGTDPDGNLINILGLQAGSVSFYQRTAYSTDDLINRDEFESGGRYFRDFLTNFFSKQELLAFINSHGGTTRDGNGNLKVPQLLNLIFRHFHTSVDASNLVDTVPVSESRLLSTYDTDGLKNYLHWLNENASAAALERQDFGEAKIPTALLYMQLRRALLLEIHKASVDWFHRFNIDAAIASAPINFYNIRPEPTPTKWEIIKAKVNIAYPDHPHATMAVGDYLQTAGINEPESAYLKKQKQAIADLATVQTARLQRCLTGHIDSASYRLDAWQTALFKLRLENQRQQQRGEEAGSTGIYLGCFGYVEDVRPEQRFRTVPMSEEITRTRTNSGQSTPLYEYIKNGGFVHAPSLNHALAAAVLRSGYLTHANSSAPDAFAVNLSSERIRRALFILEGIRNGQRIEALLGYQFERGLHDRASADPDLVDLNAYIYNFRDAYTIGQHYVQQQGTTATDTIPANNVVNGLNLAETAKEYPFDAVIPINPTPAKLKDAVIAEKDRLSDTLDAIKDLFVSESVYQLVQGNFDRAGALTTALKDSQPPPELEIIRTPRASQFGFTQRATIHFEDTSVNPWSPIAMTERSVMEPGVNNWIARLMDGPAAYSSLVTHEIDGIDTAPATITLDKLNLQPIDLVYISSADLQNRIAWYYRSVNSVKDDITVKITLGLMGNLLSLLDQLRQVVTSSRPLAAEDFIPASSKFTRGSTIIIGELATKIGTAITNLTTRLNQLRAIPITVGANVSTLGATFDGPEDLSDLEFDFTAVDGLLAALRAISLFGIPDSFPIVSAAPDQAAKLNLLNQARNIAGKVATLIDQATARAGTVTGSDNDKDAAILIDAGRIIFSAAFNILPKFTYHNPDDIRLSGTDSNLLGFASDQKHMELPADEWMHMLSRVRSKLQNWELIRVRAEVDGKNPLDLKPVQVPYRINDSWLGVEFPQERTPGEPFIIDQDTVALVVHGDKATDVTVRQAGLMIDEWTDSVPVKEEITGIAFNYDQPGSMPPQALLLAVTPRITGHWQWDDLLSIITDTFQRAKQRAVEPVLLDSLNKPETSILLPALLASFSKFDLDFALDYRIVTKFYAENAPVLSAMSSNQ